MTHKVYKRQKIQKTRVLSTLFVLLLACISFFIVLNIADFISSRLMNKSSIFYGGNVRTNAYVMYGICFYQVSGQSEAEALSKSIQNQGGAGYVFQQGDYFIYASMYSSFSDANSVKDKLGGSAGIINISVPVINFQFGGNPNEIVEAIDSFKKVYQLLYQASIAYDQGTINIAAAEVKINECISFLQENIYKISNISDNNIKLVSSYLTKTVQHLQTLLGKQYWGLEFNAAIKYAYFEAVFSNVALAKEL